MRTDFLKKIPIVIASPLASSTVSTAMEPGSRMSQLESQMEQVRNWD